MKRLVQPEFLDTLPPGDPRATRSRRDLKRINAWMRNGLILTEALQNNFTAGAPKGITEIGAGDGNFLLGVAQNMSPRWPMVNVTLLDLQKNVSAETLAAFAPLGWHAEAVVADVFDWAPAAADGEVILANLFLHHFEDARLAELLKKISCHTKLFIAVEPHRFDNASVCAQMLRLIGCSAVTRHDAAASIRAGFIDQEISVLWPDPTNWRLAEYRAGFFSHLFVARRTE